MREMEREYGRRHSRLNFWQAATILVAFGIFGIAMYELSLQIKQSRMDDAIMRANNTPPPSFATNIEIPKPTKEVVQEAFLEAVDIPIAIETPIQPEIQYAQAVIVDEQVVQSVQQVFLIPQIYAQEQNTPEQSVQNIPTYTTVTQVPNPSSVDQTQPGFYVEPSFSGGFSSFATPFSPDSFTTPASQAVETVTAIPQLQTPAPIPTTPEQNPPLFSQGDVPDTDPVWEALHHSFTKLVHLAGYDGIIGYCTGNENYTMTVAQGDVLAGMQQGRRNHEDVSLPASVVSSTFAQMGIYFSPEGYIRIPENVATGWLFGRFNGGYGDLKVCIDLIHPENYDRALFYGPAVPDFAGFLEGYRVYSITQ